MKDDTGSVSAVRAGTREWLGLAVLAMPTLLLSIDATVLYLAIPHLEADLRPSATETLWIIDIYGFMIAGLLVTMGTLGDRIGRRKLLMIGAVGFGAASAAAAYATDPAMLIVARALLGVAGATLMPGTLALISSMFHDARQRGLAIAVWAACFSAGVAIGPLIGGALLQVFWWGSVFLLAVPVMVVLLVAAPLLLPESRDPEAGRLDIASVALSLAAILPVIYGVKTAAADGPAIVPIAAIVIGVGFGLLFVRRQRSMPDPLLDVRLFSRPAFLGALLALFAGLTTVGVVFLYATQYLQLVVDLSPLAAGLWLLPSAIAMIVSSVAAPAVAARVPAGPLVAASLAVSGAGYLLLALTGAANGFAMVVIGLVVVYAGIGPLMALGTDLVVGAAPPERAGSAAAMSETAMEFGLALGVALLGSLGAAVYRAGMDGVLPAFVPAETAASSRDSISGAVAAGDAGIGPAAVGTARSAFVEGMNAIGLASSVLVIAVAMVAAVLLRRPTRRADKSPREDAAST